MNDPINIEERTSIWIALSEFYLDTELQESAFRHIAFIIFQSPYSLEEVKRINKYEVFPVLQPNLLSVAGEWSCFDSQWLVNRILKSLEKRSAVTKLVIDCVYLAFKWMCNEYWEKLEKEYDTLKSNPNGLLTSEE